MVRFLGAARAREGAGAVVLVTRPDLVLPMTLGCSTTAGAAVEVLRALPVLALALLAGVFLVVVFLVPALAAVFLGAAFLAAVTLAAGFCCESE